MAAAVTPLIKLAGRVPSPPHIPAGATRAVINIHLPPGTDPETGNPTGVQSGFINAELPMSAAPAAWQASHAYSLGNQITDSNGQVQQCVTAGTSGSSAPTWGTGLGEETVDSGATWQNIGTDPSALVAGPCTIYITQP
jgi:hypothetical protein